MHEPGLDQEIRFLETGAGRIAYASVGSGPPLILPALWISHLELEWGFPELRTFITGLAGGRQVIRYDRIGTGLSDRASVEPSLEAEVEALEALTAEIGSGEVDLLGISFGGCTAVEFAARNPAKVRRVALFGAFARGDDVAPPALREALLATVRAHWGAGSRALADIWIPGANASVRARFAELQRESATAEVAAAALEAVYAADVSETARRVGAPALVLHRKRDRAIPSPAAGSSRRCCPRGDCTRSPETRTAVAGRPGHRRASRKRLPRGRADVGGSLPRPEARSAIASRRSCDWSPTASPTSRSHNDSSCPSTPCTGTSPTSGSSSTSRLAVRPPATRSATS